MSPDREPRAWSMFGFWVSVATATLTLLTFAIALATPPLSGPLCEEGCFTYPYLDVESRFPRDYVWMFPAIPATLATLALVVTLEGRSRRSRQPVARFGLMVAAMATLTLVGDYALQLAVVQPSLLAGEADGIAIVSQYNPHGAFIVLEELGYLLMSLALACVGIAARPTTPLDRALKRLLSGGLVVSLLAFGGILARYGHEREYLFEIAVISIVWTVVIAGAVLTAVLCRRDLGVAT